MDLWPRGRHSQKRCPVHGPSLRVPGESGGAGRCGAGSLLHNPIESFLLQAKSKPAVHCNLTGPNTMKTEGKDCSHPWAAEQRRAQRVLKTTVLMKSYMEPRMWSYTDV